MKEWGREGETVRLSVVEFGVGWPAGVEDVGGGPVGVEGSDGLEEGGDCEEDAAGGEEGRHGVGLAREGEVVDGLLVLDGALVVLKVIDIDIGLSLVDELRIETERVDESYWESATVGLRQTLRAAMQEALM